MKVMFYRCAVCGNIVAKIIDSGVTMMCCGRPMERMKPQTREAGNEKHLPVPSFESDHEIMVKVGSVPHPMEEGHYIQWIFLETEDGGQLIHLDSSQSPETTFVFRNSKPMAVYEYCNIHGLWGVDLEEKEDVSYF